LLLTTDKAVWSVAWSPDNNWIAAVGEEGRAWIWSTSFLRSLSGTKEANVEQTHAEQTHADHATTVTSPKGRAHKKFSPFHWLHKKSGETNRR
jgi:WD40 repeat protein